MPDIKKFIREGLEPIDYTISRLSGATTRLVTPVNGPFQLSVNVSELSVNTEPATGKQVVNDGSKPSQVRYSISVNMP